jgi:trk system potassium uptake protein TrkA
MQHVRRGRIRGLHNLRDGFAEVFEAEVSDTSQLANQHVRDITLPKDVILGAIVRDGKVIIPNEDEMIKTEDILIMLASRDQAKTLEKIFSVQVDLF